MQVIDINGKLKLCGCFRAKVVDIGDPTDKQGKIRCEVPEVFGKNFTTVPALPKFPGVMDVPPLNSFTWIEFERGDVNFPLYNGIWFSAAGSDNQSPDSARGVPSNVVSGYGRMSSFENISGETIEESSSGFETSYPYSIVRQRGSGILIEEDNTPGNERWQIFHPAGSYLEYRRDGSVSMKASGKKSEWIIGADYKYSLNKQINFVGSDASFEYLANLTSIIKANKTETVKRDYTSNVEGSMIRNIEGGYQESINGTYISDVLGYLSQTILKDRKSVVGGNDESIITGKSKKTITNVVPTVSGIAPADETLAIVGDFKRTLLLGRFVDTSSLGYGIDTLTDYTLRALKKIDMTTADYALKAVQCNLEVGDYSMKSLQTIGLFSGTNDISIGSLGGSLTSLGKEPMVRGNTLVKILKIIVTMLQNHIHPTGVGPSGPMLPPDLTAAINLSLSIGSILSDSVNLEELTPTSTLSATLVYPLAAPAIF